MPSARARSKSTKRSASKPKSPAKKRQPSKSPARTKTPAKAKATPAKATPPSRARSRSRSRGRTATIAEKQVTPARAASKSRSSSRSRNPKETATPKKTPAVKATPSSSQVTTASRASRPTTRTFERADDTPRTLRNLTQSRERPASSLLAKTSPAKQKQAQCCATLRNLPGKICNSIWGTATNASRRVQRKNQEVRNRMGAWYMESIAVIVVSLIVICIAMQVVRFDPARLRLNVSGITTKTIRPIKNIINRYYQALINLIFGN